jgi:hypothetical protein
MIVRQGRNHPTQHDQRNITAAESDQHRKTQSTRRIPGADPGPHLKEKRSSDPAVHIERRTRPQHTRAGRAWSFGVAMFCEEQRSCCSSWSSFLPGLSSQILRLLDGGNHPVPNWNSFPNPCIPFLCTLGIRSPMRAH